MIFTSCVNCGADLPDIAQLTADLEAARAENVAQAQLSITMNHARVIAEQERDAARDRHEDLQQSYTVLAIESERHRNERDAARRDCERLSRVVAIGRTISRWAGRPKTGDLVPYFNPEDFVMLADALDALAQEPASDPQPETGRS